MTTGGNWWRAKEIVMRHLTRRTETRYRSRVKPFRTAPDAASGRRCSSLSGAAERLRRATPRQRDIEEIAALLAVDPVVAHSVFATLARSGLALPIVILLITRRPHSFARTSVGAISRGRISRTLAANSGANPSATVRTSRGSPSARRAKANYGVVFFIASPPPAGRVSDSASALAA
jgi:hypothetical protein